VVTVTEAIRVPPAGSGRHIHTGMVMIEREERGWNEAKEAKEASGRG
jgi:hypothetical protein